jgi:ABC-2 type transport system ATP-binding protein
LRRAVGGQQLLDGVDLAISPGARVLVYAQPERAASLLLRVLAGLVRADAGSVQLSGLPTPERWARRVAYVAPDAVVYPWLSPREALDLAGRLAGLGRAERAGRIEAAAERYRLAQVMDRSMRRSGPAISQLTAMAAATLGEPEVLLLDEPLRAVDAEERTRLLRIGDSRCTVLLASRFPATEAGLVNRVVLLRSGRVAADLSLRELAERGLDLSSRGLSALGSYEGPRGHVVGAALR